MLHPDSLIKALWNEKYNKMTQDCWAAKIRQEWINIALLKVEQLNSDTYELVKQEWKLVTMGNLSQLFKDAGLPSNSKWTNTFPKILQFLILNIEFFFYVLWWRKFWDLTGIKQNNWILFLFTFYMVHQHSQNCISGKACKKVTFSAKYQSYFPFLSHFMGTESNSLPNKYTATVGCWSECSENVVFLCVRPYIISFLL